MAMPRPASAASRWRRRVAALLFPLALMACSGSSDDSPGAVTADEAQQLNDAAAMLDANSVDATAVAGNETETP